MDNITKISLPEALPYLEKAQSEKLTLFVNPDANLETFFSYKGRLQDLHKEKLKIDMGKETGQSVGEKLRYQFIGGLKLGEMIVLNLGTSENFNLDAFFANCKCFPNDFLKNANFMNTAYLRKHNLIKKDEDSDNFGNEGFYKVNAGSKVFILSLCSLDNLETFLKNNSSYDLETLIVE